jgi:hypothetical protein
MMLIHHDHSLYYKKKNILPNKLPNRYYYIIENRPIGKLHHKIENMRWYILSHKIKRSYSHTPKHN